MSGKKRKTQKIEECVGEEMGIIPEMTQVELMKNNPTLTPAPITEQESNDKAEEVLKVIEQIKKDREKADMTDSTTNKKPLPSLDILRSKYESHRRLFAEYKFQSLNLAWTGEEIAEKIEMMRKKVLNSDGMEHLDIHTSILKGTTGVLENVVSSSITDVKGLSGRLMANKNVSNSSKLLLGELIEFISPPSNSSAVKTLLTQVVVELMKTILANNLSKSVVTRITQLEALLKEEVKTKVEDLEEELKEKIVEAHEN